MLIIFKSSSEFLPQTSIFGIFCRYANTALQLLVVKLSLSLRILSDVLFFSLLVRLCLVLLRYLVNRSLAKFS